MSETVEMKIIARIHSDFREKFGIPRQSGLVPEARAEIVFEEEFRNPDALRGIEGFSHLWLLWEFSENVRSSWSPTVRPPRLGGNTRVGVFATRSPFRPNPIGLSCVGFEGVKHTTERGDVLVVLGADLMDGTPIFDIKPYIAYADARPDAKCGFVGENEWKTLSVEIPPELMKKIPEPSQRALVGVLQNDPRPQYHADGRTYRMSYGERDVAFTVEGGILRVTEVI